MDLSKKVVFTRKVGIFATIHHCKKYKRSIRIRVSNFELIIVLSRLKANII